MAVNKYRLTYLGCPKRAFQNKGTLYEGDIYIQINVKTNVKKEIKLSLKQLK